MREKPGKAGRQVRAFDIESPPVLVDERRRSQILLEVRHAHTHGEVLARVSKVFCVTELARIRGAPGSSGAAECVLRAIGNRSVRQARLGDSIFLVFLSPGDHFLGLP